MKSQLRDGRRTVKDAISASIMFEYDFRGQERPSRNLTVARQARTFTKAQLRQYDRQRIHQEGDVRPRTNPGALHSLSTTSDGSSPQPSPSGSSRPPTYPPLPSGPVSHRQAHLSTRDANRRNSTDVTTIPDPRTGITGEPSTSRHTTRLDPPGRNIHPVPVATDVNSDMGYRIAGTLDRRRHRGSRVRDADRNVVWEENHQGDGLGHREPLLHGFRKGVRSER